MPLTALSENKAQVPDQTAIEINADIIESGAPDRKIRGLRWAIVIVAIISSTFLYSLDNTIMANIRPGIIESLGHIEMLPWMSVSYPLGEVGSCPFWGGVYQQFNNKWLYITAVLLFEVGSAVSGSAQTMSVLIVGRVLAGIGGSGIYVGTVNIITLMSRPSERAQYLSYIGVAWSLGTVLGPIVGGAFNDSIATWRWSFYINLCFAAVAAPAWIWLIPSTSPRPTSKVFHKVKQLDYIGIILFLGGITSLILVLGFGGTIWAWDDPRMIGLYVAFGTIWVAFSCQQWWSILTISPIFPIHFLTNMELLALLVQTMVAISNIVVTVYMLPLFFQFVYGDTTLRSGLYILAVAGAAIAAAGGGGAIFPKFPLYVVWFLAANIFTIVGATLLTTISEKSSRGAVCGYAIIHLIGGGLIVQLPFTVAQVKAKSDEVRSVNTFLTTVQMLSVAVSLGIATTLFVNVAVPVISLLIPGSTKVAVYAALEGGSNTSFNALPEVTRQEMLRVIARSIAKVFYINVTGGSCGLIAALALKREQLVL